jgi:hypothetical protein
VTQGDIIPHSFNGMAIGQRASDGYVDATAMCQASGKLLADYLRLISTQEYLESLSIDMGIPISVLVQTRRGGNSSNQRTWVHPEIAIDLGKWCSTPLRIAVNRWVVQWLATGRNPLADIDRVGLRDGLKDDSRLRACDQVKVYLEQIERYDDKKYRGYFFAQFHDALNKSVTAETAKQMRERLSDLLGKTVKEDELIRDYFPSSVLQHYISMCEASANLMLKEGFHPLTAVERAAEIVLPMGYRPTPINFVEHIKFVRQRLITGQGGFELPGF